MGSKIKTTLLAALVIGLVLAIFVRMMNYDMRRDEQLYVPPAVLLSDQALYQDFFYNHVPGTAWLFHASHVLTPGEHILLSSRLSIFAGWLLLGGAIAWLTWRLTRSRPFVVFATLSMIANDVMLGVVGMTATNNFLPSSFAFLGLGFFILGIKGESLSGRVQSGPQAHTPDTRAIFLSGICLSIAATFKVSACAYILPIALAAFLLPASKTILHRLRNVVAPLAMGGLLGGTPVLIMMARNPDLFFAHVLGFHTGPHVDYWAMQTSAGVENVAMSLFSKVMLAFAVWFTGVNILLVFLMLTFLAILILHAGSLRRFMFDDGLTVLVLCVFSFVFLLSFAPTPSFPQYFAPPMIVLPLLLSLLYIRLDGHLKPVVNMFLVTASLTILILSTPRLIQHAPNVLKPQKWTVNRVHDAGQNIATVMSKAGVKGKVATLLPIYPLEGGLPVYSEFATGQFAYRIADLTKPELLQYYRTTSPTKIEALFAADPPAAILVGFEPVLEVPFVQFAENNGYQRIVDFKLKDRYGDGVLYLRGRE